MAKSRLQPQGKSPAEPSYDCDLCPRLAAFHEENRQKFPAYHNGPVASFGDTDARLLIVGLAPGLHGANQTSRPFTGDYAGDLLYETLGKFGFAAGTYQARIDDGLAVTDCMITNAVRCVPPQNKPVGSEIANCRPFLVARIKSLKKLKVIMALGRIAHESVIKTLELRQKDFPFAHNRLHDLGEGLTLIDSYHCSRYNTNTGRLTPEMFEDVFRSIRDQIT
ncbi:MAG: uracil-DNA glycosylase [Alphaproteobacteria bacterium]|nr:MAG: uracil-DNA glycosylase [Alphaproteobacteria bacterium]